MENTTCIFDCKGLKREQVIQVLSNLVNLKCLNLRIKFIFIRQEK